MDDPSHSWTAVVLAVSEGKRMRSPLATVLHPLEGRSTVRRIAAAVREHGFGRCGVIIVPGAIRS